MSPLRAAAPGPLCLLPSTSHHWTPCMYSLVGLFTVGLLLNQGISSLGARASSRVLTAAPQQLEERLAHSSCSAPVPCAEGDTQSPPSLCAQAAKGGTIKAASGFSATEDAQTLRKAMKGLGKCPAEGRAPCVLCVTGSHRGCCVH